MVVRAGRPSGWRRDVLAVAAVALLGAPGGLAGCTDDAASPTTSGVPTTRDGGSTITSPTHTTAPTTTEPVPGATTTHPPVTSAASAGWQPDTSACADAAAARAPITGTIRIGSVMPLTGGVAAAAYAPVAAGLRAAIDHANAAQLLGDVAVQLDIADDRFDPTATKDAVDGLVDAGASVFTAIAGADDNLAVRTSLNARCIPQLAALSDSPQLNDIATAPWTMGLLVPADVEAHAWARQLAGDLPSGATVAMLAVDGGAGQTDVDAFSAAAPAAGLKIVDVQRIGATTTDPPTAAIAHLAALRPDAVVLAPVGPGCITALTELAAARAATKGAAWAPETIVAAGCADHRLLAAAGSAADGVLTTAELIDPASDGIVPAGSTTTAGPTTTTAGSTTTTSAAGDDLAARRTEALAAMRESGVTEPTDQHLLGWTAGEVTIEILRRAAAGPGGLSRVSIMAAARSLEVTPLFARPGITLRTSGTEDTVLASSVQVVRWQAGPARFEPVGPVLTSP